MKECKRNNYHGSTKHQHCVVGVIPTACNGYGEECGATGCDEVNSE